VSKASRSRCIKWFTNVSSGILVREIRIKDPFSCFSDETRTSSDHGARKQLKERRVETIGPKYHHSRFDKLKRNRLRYDNQRVSYHRHLRENIILEARCQAKRTNDVKRKARSVRITKNKEHKTRVHAEAAALTLSLHLAILGLSFFSELSSFLHGVSQFPRQVSSEQGSIYQHAFRARG
jgi:hypothetical protein